MKWNPSHLFLLGALIFGIAGIDRVWHGYQFWSLETKSCHMEKALQAADNITDASEAIFAYQNIIPTQPDIQLRILQRQWRMALDMLDRIKRAKFNAVLDVEVPSLYKALADHLEGMKDSAAQVLTDSDSLKNETSWRIHNLRGAVKLLSAFIVLDTERNWKKVQGTLKEAISDLKSAVALVDTTDLPAVEKNIPRWNLELLQENQLVKKISVSHVKAERRLELKSNLEAIIPEKGGYAPGEPLDMRVKK